MWSSTKKKNIAFINYYTFYLEHCFTTYVACHLDMCLFFLPLPSDRALYHSERLFLVHFTPAPLHTSVG